MNALIIGAGIGGLCLAQLLQKNGVSVQIFERDASAGERLQGYRLHLDADGISALQTSLPERHFQVLELTSTNPLPYTTILDTALHLSRRFPIDSYSKTEHHQAQGIAKHLNVNRATVREILLAGLEGCCHYGARLARYEATEQGVTAFFEDGRTATGDVLVGADGAGSVVRRQRAPEARFMDSGARAIYGRLGVEAARRVLPALCIADVFTAASDARKLILGVGPVLFPVPPAEAAQSLGLDATLSPQADYVGCIVSGRKEFFGADEAAVRLKTSDELQQLATELLSDWPSEAAAVPAAGEKGSFFYLEMGSSIPFALPPHPRVTLLGDAIHTMTPSLGRGANVALRDAALLGQELLKVVRDEKALPSALHDYETEMTAYGFNVVRQSAEMGTRLLGQDPLPA